MRRSTTTWDNLLVDRNAVPVRVDDARFRQWMAGQRIFVSSTMDAEMTPYRDAVRAHLDTFGPGVAVMWETISPRDQGPVRAFLDGVDSSHLLMLMLGARYGVADVSGYSPTHMEATRARERNLPILLFTLPTGSDPRDGRLNDWLRSLHIVTSGHQPNDAKSLVQQLDVRLRELAARAERNWVKLGRSVFPGRVVVTTERQQRTFTVTARTRDATVLHDLRSLAQRGGGGDLRLTWGYETFPVVVQGIQEESEYVGEAELKITCHTPPNWHGDGGVTGFTYNGIGPDEMSRQWARHAIFGESSEHGQHNMMGVFSQSDCPPLPAILIATKAAGWLAEGLVRLYAVEELARQRGGRFTRLEVGPSSASGIRVEGEFQIQAFGGQPTSPVPVSGVVPLDGTK